MKDFPSCFGESGVQVSDSTSGTSKAAQNLVTCLYQAQLFGRSCAIIVTWSKNLMGQGLSIEIDDLTNRCLCKVEVKPWFFSKRKGCGTMEAKDSKIVVFGDLSAAKFGFDPEPLEDFYVAVLCDNKTILHLGDLSKSSTSPPSNAVFIAKKAHIYDNGQFHEIAIECDTVGLKDPCLEISIHRKRVMQVQRLAWKFRGNQTILVDGLPVEVFWDVHSWLFGAPSTSAVFMFRTCLSSEKLLPWSRICLEK